MRTFKTEKGLYRFLEKKGYRIYLFDIDGTLINSEDTHYAIHCRILGGHGHTLERDFYDREFRGHQDMEIYTRAKELFDLPESAEALVERKTELFLDAIKAGRIVRFPYADRAIAFARERAEKLVCVSSEPVVVIDAIRETFGWQFDEVYSTLTRNTTKAQIYEQLPDRDQSVLFEGSPYAVKAAAACGIASILYDGETTWRFREGIAKSEPNRQCGSAPQKQASM